MGASTAEVVSLRRSVLDHWRKRASALVGSEAAVHAAMDPAIRRILEGKNILLFKEMLHDIGFPAADDLAHYMTAGFPLAGEFPQTGVFPEQERTANFSVADLWASAAQIRAEVIAACRGSGDLALDEELFATTCEEAEKGWLRAPLSQVELAPLGSWVPSRRFGIRQGGKLRAIDDYTVSRVNSALSTSECIDPDDVDQIVANCRLHADAFVLPPGDRSNVSPFKGIDRHPDVEGDVLVGRLWDIASAYRNLAVRPSQRSLAVIAVWNPALPKVELFQQLALPFGASASVLSFNWVAVALGAVLTRSLLIGSTGFYDDFTIIERGRLAQSATESVEAFFGLLGWPLKPLPGFSQKPEPLGAVVDLTSAHAGEVHVGNRPARVSELGAAIEEFLSADVVDPKVLERIRGRILFSRSLCFGRFAGAALQNINEFCSFKALGLGR